MQQRDRVDGAGLLAALLSVVAWQSGLIVQKGLAASTNAGSLMLIQVGSAAALMWLALLLAGKRPAVNRQMALNVGWGLLAPGLVFGFGIAGAARTDGVSIALFWGILPLLGPFLARLLLGEELPWTFPVGGAIGLAGLALMLSGSASAPATDPIGNLLVLASVLCAGFSSVIARFINRGRDTWFASATLQLTGATLMAIAIVLLWGWSPPPLAEPGVALSMVYLVLVMTIFNYVAFNFSMSRLAVTWAGLTAATAPVIGLALAWLLLGAKVGATELTAAAIIISGVALPHLWRLARAARSRGGG